MNEIRAQLGRCAVGDRVLLSGKLIVGRDAAHQKWHELIEAGKSLPAYLAEHPIYYAGPADTPEGKTIGSFGPTTAQRMDAYADELMSRGASLVTLAKGNRAASWTAACKKYGGFYLGTVGGAAALIAEENITNSEVIDYPELGMEAVRLIRVVDLIAFVIADDKGNELYARIASA
jgi:fumarate hydratase class I